LSISVAGVHGEPCPDHQRDGDRRGADLQDAEDQQDEGQEPRARDLRDDEAEADQQRLDQRNPDDAARDLADGEGGEIDEIRAVGAGDAQREPPDAAGEPGRGGEQEARDDHCGEDRGEGLGEIGHQRQHVPPRREDVVGVAAEEFLQVRRGERP
jgi:hypothetical protein